MTAITSSKYPFALYISAWTSINCLGRVKKWMQSVRSCNPSTGLRCGCVNPIEYDAGLSERCRSDYCTKQEGAVFGAPKPAKFIKVANDLWQAPLPLLGMTKASLSDGWTSSRELRQLGCAGFTSLGMHRAAAQPMERLRSGDGDLVGGAWVETTCGTHISSLASDAQRAAERQWAWIQRPTSADPGRQRKKMQVAHHPKATASCVTVDDAQSINIGRNRWAIWMKNAKLRWLWLPTRENRTASRSE